MTKSLKAGNADLDPKCPLCRGLRPRGWPQNWTGHDVGEKIDIYLHPWDVAVLPEQLCPFCCFIRETVDYLCRQGNHEWPDVLPIRGEPAKTALALPTSHISDNQVEDEVEVIVQGTAPEKDLLLVEDDNGDYTSDSDVDEKVSGSIELFRSRPYSLLLELRPNSARSRKIRVFTEGDGQPDQGADTELINCVDPKKQLPWLQLQSAQLSPINDTSSDATIEWVKSRIADCKDGHSLCGSFPQDDSEQCRGRLPKRVIDISSYPNVRLIETTGQKSHYACLSHRWGSSATITTETSTLKQRLDSISWEHLPKTFQQAITVVHQLDIHYLWIDSLCIIQDSEQDWLEQSGQMATIYSNAFITIAATRAQDGSEGFFSCNETRMTWNGIPLVLREQSKHPTVLNATLTDFPLLQRAWVAQEMLLSARVLHFCEGIVIFECMQSWSCPCDDSTNEHNSIPLKSPVWTNYNPPPTNPTSPETITNNPQTIPFDKWTDTVRQYTKLQLTFEKDRLPAISGLARRFAQKHNCTYAAGLWHEDLFSNLLWCHDAPTHRNPASTAPSWSWASTADIVNFYSCNRTNPVLYCGVISIDCVPLSSHDPYGQLSSATLVVDAYLLPFRIQGNEYSRKYGAVYRGKSGIKVYPDIDLGGSGEERWGYDEGFYGLPVTRTSFDYDDFRTASMRTLYTCLGLVVRRTDGGRFERVGLWTCTGEEGYHPLRADECSAEKLHAEIDVLERETVVLV